MNRALRALIFDVDGTLAETEELHRLAFNETFAAFGLDWTWDRACYRGLLAVDGGRQRLATWITVHAAPIAARVDHEAFIDALHRAKTRRYGELVADRGLPLRPGIARLLDEAHAAGLELAIATTTSAVNVEALLAPQFGDGWRRRFAAVVTGSEIAALKPAPDLYAEALRRLRLEADAALAFEDSSNGIRSAQAAGIGVVATPTWYSSARRLPDALITLPHLGDPGCPLPPDLPGAPWVDIACLRAWHACRRIRSRPLRETPPCC